MGLLKALRRIATLSRELHWRDNEIIVNLVHGMRDSISEKDFWKALEQLEDIEGQVDYFDGWIAEIYPKEPDFDDEVLMARTAGATTELHELIIAVEKELRMRAQQRG